ncbi:MAG: zinc ribbon domain-containing protein [Epulopiscium sp.]|nr:zinc ribbon domain-containing protein [Candidatus Epulonipiscium sp.]
MKDVFDRLTQSAKDISKGVIEQTKTTANQGKVELELVQAKSSLNKLYTKLGEMTYENRLSEEENPEIEILYEKISKQDKEVRELEKQSKEMRKKQKHEYESTKRNVKKTWNNNAQQGKGPEVDKDGYLQMKFCPNCNIGNHPDAEYCIACGHRQ